MDIIYEGQWSTVFYDVFSGFDVRPQKMSFKVLLPLLCFEIFYVRIVVFFSLNVT